MLLKFEKDKKTTKTCRPGKTWRIKKPREEKKCVTDLPQGYLFVLIVFPVDI